MSDTFKTYLDFSQFSMAAYADLFTDISGDAYRGALQTAGFSGVLAGEFATANEGYAVRSVSPDDPLDFGFSATLFEKLDRDGNGIGQFTLAIRGTNDAADIPIDAVSIGILGSENLNPQYAALNDQPGVFVPPHLSVFSLPAGPSRGPVAAPRDYCVDGPYCSGSATVLSEFALPSACRTARRSGTARAFSH